MYLSLSPSGVQDVNDMWSFQHPNLYVPGQLNQYFSKTAFFKCALHSVYSSVVLFFIPYAAMYDTVRDDGRDIADYQSFALLAQTCLVITVCIQLCLDMSYWTAVNQVFVWGSLAMYFVVTFSMYSNGTHINFPASFPFIGTARNSLNQPNVWLTILLTSILCVLPVVAYRFLLIQLRPTINDKVMFKVRQAKATPPLPARRARMRRTSSRRSGYAFSHAQGYGDLVTSNHFLRRPAITRSTAFTPLGRTTGFSPMGRSAGYSPTGNALNSRPQEVEVTSLQMYRMVRDSAF
ncbi:probable phospholipid-transporting ATPase IM [Salvelinus namaycush]|uniref:Probable phospholipid-transporting ATPase IM n=1 Tax=Salvelinus namaycush TaxID=8040 RepID=A0A8U0QBW8_SALNM|nr:probable phospholipid-transporting ATPase IM [Salvelinus namaycush]